MGFVGICVFLVGDVGDDAVTVLDYVAIGLLAVCLDAAGRDRAVSAQVMIGARSGQDATERQGRE
jgi:hypothetical protein